MIEINSDSNRATADEHRQAEALSFSLTHSLSLCMSVSQLSGSEGIFSLAHLAP